MFFRQERIGKDGRPFRIFKFRTMVDNAYTLGPRLTQKRDPRVTRVGLILRWLKLDELPQLLNVLAGDMSFVGPRPEDPHFVRLYTARAAPGPPRPARRRGPEPDPGPRRARAVPGGRRHRAVLRRAHPAPEARRRTSSTCGGPGSGTTSGCSGTAWPSRFSAPSSPSTSASTGEKIAFLALDTGAEPADLLDAPSGSSSTGPSGGARSRTSWWPRS